MKKLTTFILCCAGSLSMSAQTASVTGLADHASVSSRVPSSGSSTPVFVASHSETRSVMVLPSFTNSGWASKPVVPAGGRWGTAPVFTKPCVSGTDTGYIYLIAGYDASFANTTVTSAYNITTGVWKNKTAIPATRGQCTPLQVNKKIYVIGGYGASAFSPVTTNSIYDVTTDTWTTGAPIPTAVGDYASGIYKDSLIYIIGGYNGSGDVNLVQVYNIFTNTWSSGTAKTGTAVAGLRGAITGNKIVLVGGYSQTLATEVSEASVGVISVANPLSITWSPLPAYPGGTSGRLGAGTLPEANGLVYFAGGDPDGSGTSVMNQVYAYNTVLNEWESGPNMITGVSNISGLAGVVQNDTLYIVTMGGYNGTSVSGGNEWLKIGPATQQPAVQAGVTICSGNSTVLTASNGITYSWSPAGSLSNASIAAPTATPSATTTYTVNISTATGCVISKNVTVTVNPLPIADAGSPVTVCAGNSTMLTATGGTSYSWLPAAGLDNANINTPTATPAGTTTYTVTVTDLNGCMNTDNVMVTINPLPIADAGSPAAVCAGNSTMLTATGGTSYSWLPVAGLDNANIDMPTATPTGTTTYTVTVTDVNGCMNTDNVMITVNPLPIADAGSSAAICPGYSAMLTATGGTSYSWLPAAGLDNANIDMPTATPTATTTYTVNVTDANGCSNTASVTVTVNDLPAATVSSTNISCNGSADGTASASVAGTSTYSYLWSTTATSSSVSGLSADPYSVTITDDVTGCISNVFVTITEPDAIVLTVTNDTANTCNGTLMVMPAGGTPAYTYLWNDPLAQTSDTPVNLCPGTYMVQVTDANGCTATTNATVYTTTSIAEGNLISFTVYPNPANEDLTISGDLNGTTSITLLDVLGKQVMNIADNAAGNFKTTVSVSMLSSGVYFLQLKSKNTISTKKIIKK